MQTIETRAPEWVQTLRVNELSGKHTGMAISLGHRGTSLGWSWTVGGVLIGVSHSVETLNSNGTRDLAKSRLRVMLRTDPAQQVEFVIDATPSVRSRPGPTRAKCTTG